MTNNILKRIYNREENLRNKNNPIKDFILFAAVTLIFHFIYWHTSMDTWLFGSYTSQVYDFFTDIAFKGSKFFVEMLFSTPFDTFDTTFRFYHINTDGIKEIICSLAVVESCSGIKQLFQLLMIMLVVPNKLWKRISYFFVMCFVVLFFNIVRIVFLTAVLVQYGSNTFQWVHDWIGRPFHYVIIFLIWVLWIEKFAYPKRQKQTPPVPQVED